SLPLCSERAPRRRIPPEGLTAAESWNPISILVPREVPMQRTNGVCWIVLALGVLASALDAQKAYVTNSTAGTVSVIDTSIDAVVSTIPVGTTPNRLAISADGKHAYVPN